MIDVNNLMHKHRKPAHFPSPHSCARFPNFIDATYLDELGLISEQKVENIFVAPPYCQTACAFVLLCNIDEWLGEMKRAFFDITLLGYHNKNPVSPFIKLTIPGIKTFNSSVCIYPILVVL